MEYEILYHVLNDNLWLMAGISFFIGIATLAILFLNKEAIRGRTTLYKFFRVIGLGVIACVCFVFAYSNFHRTYQVYQSVKLALDTGTYSVIEGRVEEFTSEIGGRKESFFVQDVYFEYRPFNLEDYGYNKQAKQNGVIHEKSGVLRIDYIEKEGSNRILRVWRPMKKDK